MSIANMKIEPEFSAQEREELAHLDYFARRVDELRDRGLISPECYQTIATENRVRRETVTRRGIYKAALNRARKLTAAQQMPQALEWAGLARAMEPEARGAWDLEISLSSSLGRHEEAIALCAEAALRFPDLAARLESLRREEKNREAQERRSAEKDRKQPRIAKPIEHKRQQPEASQAAATSRVTPVSFTPELRETVTPLSWSSIAGEFLQEHWQKLILCLAVLLIVVSSTVGAHLLLGDRLWSPLGKCSLAMVATLMFAALGMGLIRWGAERAGQMMLVTTLIVVPIHFMLGGELKLLLEPSAWRIGGFAVQIACLLALSRIVGGRLLPRKDAWYLAVPLILMSVFNVTMARGVPGPWAWQFAAFQVPAAVLLAAVWGLKLRAWEPSSVANREFGNLLLGLLGFALVTSLIRTGGYALGLAPTLFAVPVMLAATASVDGARWLSAYEPDKKQIALMRLGGYVLAGLAFALALARPLAPSPLFSGNTLTVAILGLLLFARSLRVERHPAFVYFGFAAFFLAYFGAYYFLHDLLSAIEDAARSLLGYADRLPGPFRAINGLLFNSLLAALAIHFSRRWKDERLARHCHYVGVPFSIAACLYSGFEPEAALICLSGYTVLYLIAAWLFRAAWVQYLAITAMSAGAYFASTFLPWIGLGELALGAGAIGLSCTLVALIFRGLRVDDAYRRPWVHGGLALSALAMVGTTIEMLLSGTTSFLAALSFLLVSATSSLANIEERKEALGYLSLLSANVSAALGLVTANVTWHLALGTERYAVVAGLAGLIEVSLGALLGLITREEGRRKPLQSYVWPLRQLGLIVAAVAVGLCILRLLAPIEVQDSNALIEMAVALGSSSAAFAIGTAVVHSAQWLACATVWTAVASYFCGVLGVLRLAHVARVGATMDIAVAAGSLLLFAVWHQLRISYYRKPLLYTALALVMIAGLIGYALWHPSGHVALTLALCGLALVALVGEIPRTSLVHVSLVAFLGVWLKGLDRVIGSLVPDPTLFCGLAVTSFNIVVLGVAELVGPHALRPHDEIELYGPERGPSRARLYHVQIPRYAIVVSILADALVWMNLGIFWWTGPILLMTVVGLLWSSRFVRERTLVYLGLWHLVAATLDLAQWYFGWNSLGMLIGWQTLVLALTALLLWLAGVVGRRYRLEETYWVPCFNSALALTAVVFISAVLARAMTREVFAISAGTLVLDSLVCLLIGRSRGWAPLTYPAVASFVTASYVILLSTGRNDPAMAYVLGLNAVIQALLFWGLGDLCRRRENAWTRSYAPPLFHSALVLTVLAIPLAYQSPVTMVLVAISFLLSIKSLPRTEWIYPAVAALSAALYFPWLAAVSRIELIAVCVVAAYLLWAFGLLVRRGKSVLVARLGLQPLDYEMPLFNLAAAGGLLALLLKFDRGLDHLSDLTSNAWVPLALSPVAFGMVRAYPRREVIHLSVGLLCWGVISLIAPSLFDPAFVALALAALCVGLELMALVIRPGERSWVERAGLDEPELLPIIRGWSLGAFGLGVLLAGLVVVSGMAAALLGVGFDGPAITRLDWWAVLAAIVLLGVRIGLVPLDSRLFRVVGAEGLTVCLELTGLAVLWWLGVASSPVARWGLVAGDYFPQVTALATFAIVELNRRLARRQSWSEDGIIAFAFRPSQSCQLSTALVLTLSVLSALFTVGRENPTTVATLVVIAVSAGHWAIAVGESWPAYLGCLAWSAAGFVAGLVIARRVGLWLAQERLICAALGGLVAGFAILAVAGLLRRVERNLSREKARSALDPRVSFTGLAIAVEQVAFACALLAAGLVGVASVGDSPLTGWLSAAGIGALLAVALFLLVLVPRWQREWLVYLSQAALLGAYVLYRLAHPLALDSDSVVLTLFAFVDLGIAEVMERLRLPLYARPTRYASLVLPVLPLVFIVGTSGLDDLTVFHLLAAGTFYAVACGTLRWKELGYAAGVLYNAALWVLWGRMGWQLADHPQFHLVPVGLSAILFAESNRAELGRETVNTVRTAGLIVTYLAMATPIWQDRSFGDWVALLLGSLLGLFFGIGLRVQTFVWLGLVTFLLDVLYELGRVSLDHALAKWAIMLSLGISLVFFVALNEKKQIVRSMRGYFEEVRSWE